LIALCRGRGDRPAAACAALAALPIPRTLRVTVADPAGAPVAGVLVGEHANTQWRPFVVYSFTAFSGRTDASGRLDLSESTGGASERLLVRAVKPGYFTAAAAFTPGRDVEHHFTLRRWVLTAVDQTIRGTTRVDALCEPDPYPCQRYVVVAPRTGRLEVSVAAANRQDMDLWIGVPDGDIYAPQTDMPLQLEIDAVAGAPYEIWVISYRCGPREFELSIRTR
jgi:hypothetical protein